MCINYICTYICLSVCQCLGIPEERFGFPGAQVTGGSELPRVIVGTKLRSSGRTSPLNCWAIYLQSKSLEGQSTCKMTTTGKGRGGETRDRSRGRCHQNKDIVKDVMTSQNSSVPDSQKQGVLELRKIVWVWLYPGDFQEKLKNHGRDRSVCTYVCCAGLNTLNTCLFSLFLLRFIHLFVLGWAYTCHDTCVVIRG